MTNRVARMRLIGHCSHYECSEAYTKRFSMLLDEYAATLEGCFGEDVIDALLSLLSEEGLGRCEYGFWVFYELHISARMGFLEKTGLARIRQRIAAIYPTVSGAQVEKRCITLLEFIVDNGSAEDSEEILAKYLCECSGTPLALISYGFYYLFKQSEEETVRKACSGYLECLSASTGTKVAAEAQLHLEKIHRMQSLER